ncbi:MAG: DUF1573 domain-containing protein [Alistipes sp.]|nr:DUF1573 domain-containing protein [Alistipes sp.]
MMLALKRFISCLVLLLTINCLSAQQARPIMVFDRVSHDFGDVKRKGGDLIKEFRFVNKGDAPLVIKKITKSCSCMSVTYSRKPVLPGESSVIKIKYEPHKVEAGVFNKVIQIYSNDATGKVRLITIQGNSVDEMK